MSNDYPPYGSGQEPTGGPHDPTPPAGQPVDQPGYGTTPPPPPPPGTPGPYGAPEGYPQPQQTSPLAIVSLVTGILGVLCCNFFVLSIAAVVTGIIGRKQIAQSGGRQKGDGLAKAGLVLGIVGLVLGVVLFVLNIAFGWNSGEINVG